MTDHQHHEHYEHDDHSEHAAHADHSRHGHDHGGHGGHGDHAGQFRRLFWVSLILSIPVVILAPMLQDWLNYSVSAFPGDSWVSPILGTIIFVYGGRIFLDGAVDELKMRQPGMMTLISLAISVAFIASLATTLGWLDLDFWWELSLLVTVMLLGHWVEMRALGASQNALQALADLVPDEAERIVDGNAGTVSVSELQLNDIVLVRPGGSVPADGVIDSGSAEIDSNQGRCSRRRHGACRNPADGGRRAEKQIQDAGIGGSIRSNAVLHLIGLGDHHVPGVVAVGRRFG